MSDDDVTAAQQARGLARGIAAYWQEALGERLLGFYLIGSLAHGGFSARYSDIDVGLVTTDGVAAIEIEAMRQHARKLSSELASKLSLFWTDRGFTIGRFPPLDRLDYLDHAQVLVERERAEPKRPSLDEVRTYLRGQPLESFRDQIARVMALTALDDPARRLYLRALLYPARFLYSWHTGRMGSNDEAVALLHEHQQPGLDLDLIDRALACRRDNRPSDALFAERGTLAAQLAVCAKIAGV
jgi:predicted nucleotidyltransferase